MENGTQYRVACKGLGEGEHTFRFGVDKALFEAFGNGEIHDCDCIADVTLSKSGHLLMFGVSIAGWVEVECDRCLGECRLPVNFSGSIAARVSGEDAGYDGETIHILSDDDDVDLGQYIYESVLLSLPYRRVHADGDCDPAMLARFSVATAEEFDRMEAEAERRAAHGLEAGDMAKLAALKAGMESQE